MQYHAIPCNTMHRHTLFITADGAYHCPVGSIWPFYSRQVVLKKETAFSRENLHDFASSVVSSEDSVQPICDLLFHLVRLDPIQEIHLMLPDYILAIKMSCPIPSQNSRLNQRLPQGRKCHRSSSLEVHEGAGEECRQSIFPSCRCSSSAQECFGRGASLTSGQCGH